jgi:DNA helicase II / ATP-dependent DNA helicase PcrA
MASAYYSTTAKSQCVLGLTGTGKTTHLVHRVKELIESGASASNIIVFAATPSACSTFTQQLENVLREGVTHKGDTHEGALPNGAAIPRVTTLFVFELELLSTQTGISFTGRQPHVLLRYEENILLEDMKTSGIQPKRLVKMLPFFYRSWTELENMTSDWFISDEEENAHKLLQQYLSHYGAYLEAEVANKAFHLLQHMAQETDQGAQAQIPHVLVDDYQMLSKASQCFASLLAAETLTIAGDEVARVEALEKYPYPDGIKEFREQNPACEIIEKSACHASRAIVEAINDILIDEALDSHVLPGHVDVQDEAFKTLSFAHPEDEFEGVASLVASEIENGVSPEDIFIATTKPLWGKNIAKALKVCGIGTSFANKICVAGDFRTVEKSIEARVVTLLKLIANPSDQLALRCWCAFDDYLGNSGVFSQIVKEKRSLALTHYDINFDEHDALSVKEGASVSSSLQKAAAIIEEAKDLRGLQLLEALTCAVCEVASGENSNGENSKPRVPSQLLCALRAAGKNANKNATAATIVQEIETGSLFPKFSSSGVRIGSLEDFAGMNAQLVIIPGLVNGFTPARSYFDPTVIERDKRPALLSKAMYKVYSCMGKATRALYLTYFEEAPLTQAETLQLKIERVRLRNGKRMCEIHPSETIRSITGVYFHE